MRARSGVCVRPVPFNEPQDKTVAEPEHEEIDEGETDLVSSVSRIERNVRVV